MDEGGGELLQWRILCRGDGQISGLSKAAAVIIDVFGVEQWL